MADKFNQDSIVSYPARWEYVERAINECVEKAVANAIKNLLTEGILKKGEEETVRYYTKSETAKVLHVSVNSIDNYVKSGKLKPFKLGGRVLFSSQEIMSLSTNGIKYKR